MNHIGIDVFTKDKAKLIARLKALVSTEDARDGGMYREDKNYSQVHLDTTKTEMEVDAWLYTLKGIDYVGTFDREPSDET
jgi:hypothetical protein